MLVGRDREIAALDAAIERARSGERAAVMLTGEPGIGKSRLLDELATHVVTAGGVAAWGRSAEVGLTPAFWPWMQVLATLETPDVRAPELATFDQPAVAMARLARFEDVVAFVRTRARETPVALLFDDAHAADLASLQLLEYALPRLVGRVVVAVAARDGDATPAAAAVLGKIQRAARRLPLARLCRDDVARLCGERVATATTARVWELTEGNPLFVEELVGSLGDTGAVALPAISSVRATIRERIERMPDNVGELLAAAALVGREFRAAVVADICGIADDEAVRRLDPVLRLGMVSAMTGDRYRFSHALIAEALGDELEPSERARLHLRAAQAIEKRDDGEPAAVAHHLLAAGHLAAEAAVAAAGRAATVAMARLGFEDAAALLERAVAALVLAAPSDRGRRAALLGRWAEALQHAGEHTRAAALCDEAIRIARDLTDADLHARVAIVRGLEYRFGHTDPLLVEVLREAVTALGQGDLALRAKLLARLAAAEQPARDPTDPVTRARAAIELARGLSDRDRLDVMYTATAALVDYVAPTDLEPIHREVLALATAANDRPLIVHTLIRLCFTTIERLDRAGFDKLVGELRPRIAALGISRWVRTLHLLDAFTALLDGRFGDAERATDAADATVLDADARWLVDAHRLMATFMRAQRCPPELRELAASYPAASLVFRCWIAAHDHDLDETHVALAHLGELPDDLALAGMLADPLVLAGSHVQRESLYARMLPLPGRILVATLVGTAVLEVRDRGLLVLAASTGRWDAIDGHAADALVVAEQLASPVLATLVRADWADALDQRGQTGDADRARELRTRALVDAERIGMPRIVERCRSRTATPPAPKPAATDRVELVRSGELWLVHGFGEQSHVKDSRGVQILARLLENPGIEIHVLDLSSGGGGAVDGGDAGEALDATARAAYRDRLRELTATRDEAESWGDLARLERTNAEIEALSDELGRAVGLGGRERRVGSASERARSNVQRRIHHALLQIRQVCPRIGEHLAATVHTGTYCHYAR